MEFVRQKQENYSKVFMVGSLIMLPISFLLEIIIPQIFTGMFFAVLLSSALFSLLFGLLLLRENTDNKVGRVMVVYFFILILIYAAYSILAKFVLTI